MVVCFEHKVFAGRVHTSYADESSIGSAYCTTPDRALQDLVGASLNSMFVGADMKDCGEGSIAA